MATNLVCGGEPRSLMASIEFASVSRERSHVVERVFGIGLSVVWHDGDRPDADFAQRVSFHHDAADRRLYVRTVITDKDNERAFRPTNLRKRINFAIDTLKGEIPCLPSDPVGCVQNHQAFSAIEAPPDKDSAPPPVALRSHFKHGVVLTRVFDHL